MTTLNHVPFNNESEMEAYLATASIQELVPLILKEPIDFGMVIAWGSYHDDYEFGTESDRESMLRTALEQMPAETLASIFYAHFIAKQY